MWWWNARAKKYHGLKKNAQLFANWKQKSFLTIFTFAFTSLLEFLRCVRGKAHTINHQLGSTWTASQGVNAFLALFLGRRSWSLRTYRYECNLFHDSTNYRRKPRAWNSGKNRAICRIDLKCREPCLYFWDLRILDWERKLLELKTVFSNAYLLQRY